MKIRIVKKWPPLLLSYVSLLIPSLYYLSLSFLSYIPYKGYKNYIGIENKPSL